MYTFENRCLQDYGIAFDDGTTKIILNTKRTMNDVSPKIKQLLDYTDGQRSSDEFTSELETTAKTIKDHKKWRTEYMTLEMRYKEFWAQGFEEGLEQGLG